MKTKELKTKQSIVSLVSVLVLIFTSFAVYLSAQKKDSLETERTTTCGGVFVAPESISIKNDAFSNYLAIALLPNDDRGEAFRQASSIQKANFFKIHFALQLVKRPELNKSQRDFLLDLIIKSSPDLYEKNKKSEIAESLNNETEAKAFRLFEKVDALQILSGLFSNKDDDVKLLRAYEELLKSETNIRIKLSKEMSPKERADIWKIQLAYHLVTSTLLERQKEFLADTMPKIENFLNPASKLTMEKTTKNALDFETEINDVFSKPEAFAIFMSIGIHSRVDQPKTQNVFIANNSTSDCRCRTFCAAQYYSCNGIGPCSATVDGCGTWGDLPCINLCVYVLE